MVRKLIKYDFSSYFRLLLPVQLIIIGFAALNRIVQFFEPAAGAVEASQTIYNSLFVSTLVLYIISIIVCLLMTIIVGIIRFYQGMYTNEGYLSHTLPVTPTQHIFAKLLTSIIFCLGADLAIFLSFMVITAGDVNIEVFKAFFFIIGRFFATYGLNGGLYVLEFILLLISAVCFIFLKLYFCISVGQLVKRKKILLAFGVYFGIYVVKQIIGTVGIIVVMLGVDFFAKIAEWFAKNASAALHIVLCGGIAYTALFALIYFLITKYIMSKKLNLT